MNLESNMILRSAIETFGETPQIIMAMEESSELTQALSKHLRGQDNDDNIAEEIADVYIMLRQLEIIFKNESLVDDYMEKKIKRLSERLNNYKPKEDSPPRKMGATST